MTAGAGAAGEFDLVVAGGGMVGASLALALAPLGLRIALVEAEALPEEGAGGADERSIALANGSTRIFGALGVWESMRRAATPIRRIHVSERGRFGAARIDAAEQGLAALGYVVPQHVIAGTLRTALRRHPGIATFAPAQAGATTLDGDARTLQVTCDDGREEILRARLLVAADGAGSGLRTAAGIEAERWDYGQVAIVATLTTQKFHDHVAYERFTPEGPIALLPLADGRCGLVWTRAPEAAQATLALDDAAFLGAFQQAFGLRLGRFLQVGARRGWPLAMTRAEGHRAPRLVLVGNAAQGLHPVAGQGFNLGLRDAASLAETLVDARAEGLDDPGDARVLQRYAEWRAQDSGRISAFTDGLVRLFGSPLGSVRTLRGLGLLAFDALPPAKQAMARLSVGAAGRVPRLARGAPLQGGDA